MIAPPPAQPPAQVAASRVLREGMRIAGETVHSDRTIEVRYPFTGETIATVPRATVEQVRRAFSIARAYRPTLSRHERHAILTRAAELIAARQDETSCITTCSGRSDRTRHR